MNEVLARWNSASQENAATEILACCGSTAWAQGMVRCRPFADESGLLQASDEIWRALPVSEWLEAFRSHPRIGESAATASAAPRSSAWSREEQSKVAAAQAGVTAALVEANRAYEEKFGHIFIVCATGKSAPEILAILRRRMHNDGDAELREAAEEQRQITQLRLKKWLMV